MPELAEVEFARKQWNKGLKKKILAVEAHAEKKIFRGTDVAALARTLRGATLTGSETHGKQMLFRFSKNGWLGIHLGMTGELRAGLPKAIALKHDHLILRLAEHSLIFNDPRQFGRVLFYHGPTAPDWWSERPPEILSAQFTQKLMDEFFARRARAPIKAVLLMQEAFPGIGNWMADEVLWQAGVHPAKRAGKLTALERARLFDRLKFVCRESMKIVGERNGDLPKTWLFNHRWGAKGTCPKHKIALRRAEVGGRTTAWCPSCQMLRSGVN